MADISDAERLALITHEQVRLVNSEAYLLQRTMDALHDDGFEDQDDVNGHHGHSGRRRRPTAIIIPFPVARDGKEKATSDDVCS
jgi:hypothetical protein